MRDRDVRAAVYAELTAAHPQESETLLVHELGLLGEVRVDIAMVNGHLSGFELKSARDTLRRLPAQVDGYSKVLDFATLVVADCHRNESSALLPAWWGLTVATQDPDGGVALAVMRQAEPNPRVDPFSLATLLWREEALEELQSRGLDRGVRSKPRSAIWQRLAAEVPLTELRTAVRHRLKARLGWRSAR
jgi:hypothetical protein